MDGDKTFINIECYSENTHDSIGCGISVSSKHLSANEIDTADVADILDLLEECFWELLCEFESSAQIAFDNGDISGTDQDELFKVFGHFRFSITADDEPVNLNLGIDPDEFMYPRLAGYLQINIE